jgi:hypothetical protein
MSDWKDSLPDELKNEAFLKDVPDVATLAKVAKDALAFRGAAIKKPSPNATAEEKAEFLSRVAEVSPEIADMRRKLEEASAASAKAAEDAAAREKAAQDTDLSLRQEWGVEYPEKVKAAKAAAKAMGVPEAALESMPPNQVKVWAATAARVTGPGNEMGRQGGNGGGGRMTPDEARAQLTALRDDPKYWDGHHPEMHRKAADLTRVIEG